MDGAPRRDVMTMCFSAMVAERAELRGFFLRNVLV
jgi:hypothetical protein